MSMATMMAIMKMKIKVGDKDKDAAALGIP